MKTVTLDVRSPSDTMAGFTQAWITGKAQKSARISFATPELLWQVLTAKRCARRAVLCKGSGREHVPSQLCHGGCGEDRGGGGEVGGRVFAHSN